jgi:hypothetical protein
MFLFPCVRSYLQMLRNGGCCLDGAFPVGTGPTCGPKGCPTVGPASGPAACPCAIPTCAAALCPPIVDSRVNTTFIPSFPRLACFLNSFISFNTSLTVTRWRRSTSGSTISTRFRLGNFQLGNGSVTQPSLTSFRWSRLAWNLTIDSDCRWKAGSWLISIRAREGVTRLSR